MPKKKQDAIDIAVEVDERFKRLLDVLRPEGEDESGIVSEMRKALRDQIELMRMKTLAEVMSKMMPTGGGNSGTSNSGDSGSILDKLDPETLAQLDEDKLQQILTLEMMRSGKMPFPQQNNNDKFLMLLMMYMMNQNKFMSELLVKTIESMANRPVQNTGSDAITAVLEKMEQAYSKMIEIAMSQNRDNLAQQLAENYLQMLNQWASRGVSEESEIDKALQTIDKLKPLIEAFRAETTDPKVQLELEKLRAELMQRQQELELKRELELKKLELERAKLEESKKKEEGMKELISDILTSLANVFPSGGGGETKVVSEEEAAGIYIPMYCPNCGTKFSLPLKAISEGLPVRCPACSYTFIPRIAGEPYERTEEGQNEENK